MLETNDKRIEWFKNARFGLFIHWGLYSAAAGVWKGKDVSGLGESIAAKEHIPLTEYEMLAEKMTLDKFNPDYWAELAANAGMKYVVFTAKHHEGFAMYDTKYDDYSIVKRSPHGKDATREIVNAMRKKGIKPCFYYSQALDFHEKNAMGNTWDFTVSEDKRDLKTYIDGKCKFQLKELLTDYGDIGLIWMDVPCGMTKEIAGDLKAYVKTLQPDCLISGRIGGTADMGDYGCMGDNQIPSGKLYGCWETASTMNDTWGYKINDRNFKTPKAIIELLCGLISKGANLLLNIGPKANGEIPEESVRILKELAKWTKINGEVIHGTEASPFASDFTFGECCRKGNCLYFFLHDRTDKISVKGIKNKILKAEILGKGSIRFKQKEGWFLTELHSCDFGEYVTVLKVTLDGEPIIDSGLYAQEKNSIMLPAYCCTVTKNDNVKTTDMHSDDTAVDAERYNVYGEEEINIALSGTIEKWFSENDYISWSFDSDTDGEYRVVLYTMAQKYTPWIGGHTVHFECGVISESVALTAQIQTKGANKKYFDETGSIIGRVRISKGKNEFKLYADKININDSVGLNVSKIILESVNYNE